MSILRSFVLGMILERLFCVKDFRVMRKLEVETVHRSRPMVCAYTHVRPRIQKNISKGSPSMTARVAVKT